MPKKFAEIKKMPTFVAVNEQRTLIALWCNGSTSDSGSACEGSNPSRTTKTNGENTSPFIFLITNKFKLTIFNGNKD